MSVDPEGHFDALMSESFLNDLNRNAGLEEQRGARMAEPMELDRTDVGCFDQTCVFALSEIIDLQRFPKDVVLATEIPPLLREQQTVIMVKPTVLRRLQDDCHSEVAQMTQRT
jgi:hypothetical protein